MDWTYIMGITAAGLISLAFYDRINKIVERRKRPPITVDLYGDSVLYGYGVDISPADIIRQRRPEWTVYDHTAGGLDTNELLGGYSTPDPGLPTEYWRNGPQPPFANVSRTGVHVVVIQTGFNDAFHSVPYYDVNLEAAVNVVLSEGRKVVIGGVFNLEISVPLRAAYNEISHAVARKYNLVHAGWGEDYQGPADVHADTIHRTQESTNRMTDRLIAAIERAYYDA